MTQAAPPDTGADTDAGPGGARAAAPPLSVLVVDDQLAVREGVARLIASSAMPLRAVATAASGAEALRIAPVLRPRVVVLDADLAGEDGLALIPQFSARAGIVVLSCHGDAGTRARAARLGARAFVEKHQPAADLLQAIAAAAAPATGWDKAPAPAGGSTHPGAGAFSTAPASPAA